MSSPQRGVLDADLLAHRFPTSSKSLSRFADSSTCIFDHQLTEGMALRTLILTEVCLRNMPVG